MESYTEILAKDQSERSNAGYCDGSPPQSEIASQVNIVKLAASSETPATESGELADGSPATNVIEPAEAAGKILRTAAALFSAVIILLTVGVRATELFTPAALRSAAFAPCWQLVAEGISLPTAGKASAMLSPLLCVTDGTGTESGLSLSELYKADTSSAVSGELKIIPRDLSRASLGISQITNETGYHPDLELILAAQYPIPIYTPAIAGIGIKVAATNAPIVLILHTHGTESYSEEDSASYPADSGMRSEDIEKNVVSVGRVIADELNAAKIPTLHCEIMHDKESYLNSYNRSLETVLGYLEKYPSIKYIIDVHRDSIANINEGEAYKPVTLVDGIPAAQLMLVVGTDFGGAAHPRWHDNLNVAVKLQNLLNEQYGNLARPINLRNASFNQQHAAGSLLLEVGSCANTLSEAKHAAKAFAKCFANLILNPLQPE